MPLPELPLPLTVAVDVAAPALPPDALEFPLAVFRLPTTVELADAALPFDAVADEFPLL